MKPMKNVYNMDFVEIKIFCVAKKTSKKGEKIAHNIGEIFAHYISKKALGSRIQK